MISNILFYLNIILLVAGVAYISYGLITEKAARKGLFFENKQSIILLLLIPALNMMLYGWEYSLIALAGVLFVTVCIIRDMALQIKRNDLESVKRDLLLLLTPVIVAMVIIFLSCWW